MTDDLDPDRLRWLRPIAGLRIAMLRAKPAALLLYGYLSYMLLGWLLLSLPFMQEAPQKAVDTLFIAVSAVSTTGLITIDPGQSFNLAGEIVIILLIQFGGIGYMTISSFALMAAADRLSPIRDKMTRAAFSLPEDVTPGSFVRAVVIYTLVLEAIGALLLWQLFARAGVEDPLWKGIFHAISAFCTAGFSLFPNSLEDFRADVPVNVVISALSILGAMGFLVVADLRRTLLGSARHVGFTTKLIWRMTLGLFAIGTVIIFVTEPTIVELPPGERLMASFFQAMTASTTVGFNTHPIGVFSLAPLILMFFLMIIGASPSGTGGGLKTTTLAILIGLVRSTVKERDRIRYAKRRIPLIRLQAATAAFAYYFALLGVGLFLLFLTDPGANFEIMLFEAISAMGTVGLSMGITGDLSGLGKLVIILLMIAGRVGILSFGIAVASRDETLEEEQDNEILL